jgi:hypothetical protein
LDAENAENAEKQRTATDAETTDTATDAETTDNCHCTKHGAQTTATTWITDFTDYTDLTENYERPFLVCSANSLREFLILGVTATTSSFFLEL